MKSASLLFSALLAVSSAPLYVACNKTPEGGNPPASQPAPAPEASATPAPAAPGAAAAPETPAASASPQTPAAPAAPSASPAAPAAQPAASAAPPAPARPTTPPPASGPRMDFSLPLQPVSNPPVNFQAYRGKPVLIFYFGPTCPHCQAATPEIQVFSDEIRQKGVETLAIANMRSNPQEIAEFINTYRVRLPVYWDGERKFGEAYEVKSLPTLYLVGKGGEVYKLENYSGKASLDSLRARI